MKNILVAYAQSNYPNKLNLYAHIEKTTNKISCHSMYELCLYRIHTKVGLKLISIKITLHIDIYHFKQS